MNEMNVFLRKRVFLRVILVVALGFFLLPGMAFAEMRVAVTTFPLWLFTRNVMKDVPGVEVELALPAEAGCPHDYALTPQDMQRLARADVLVINGLGLDAFAVAALESIGRNIPVIDSSRGVSGHLEYEPDEDEEDAHDEDHGHHHGGANPHLFASPTYAGEMTEYIANELAQLDPDNEKKYLGNAEAYAAILYGLSKGFSEWGREVENGNVMLQHSGLAYLAEEAGLTVVAVIQEHEDQEPSAARLLRLSETIRDEETAAILTEPQYPDRAAVTLARENKIPVIKLDPAAGGPRNAPLDYYQRTMIRNLATLKKTLGPK